MSLYKKEIELTEFYLQNEEKPVEKKSNFQILEELFEEKYASKKRVSKLIVEFLKEAKERGYNGMNKYVVSYLGHKENSRLIQQHLINQLNMQPNGSI